VGETIDANTAAAARPPRFSRRAIALLSVLVIVVLGALVLALGTDDQDAGPDASTPIATAIEPVSSDSTSESADGVAVTIPTVAPSTADTTESTAPLENIAPVREPSAQDATFSVTNFLGRVPSIINPSATQDTSAAGDAEIASPDISDIVTGAMAAEVAATAAEFEAMGWTQSGTSDVVDLRVVRAPTPQEPLDAIVEVCLDDSAIQILDESGQNVRPADTPDRTLNIFVLRLVDETWLIASRTFPADADC
jgi:hypothetical protein